MGSWGWGWGYRMEMGAGMEKDDENMSSNANVRLLMLMMFPAGQVSSPLTHHSSDPKVISRSEIRDKSDAIMIYVSLTLCYTVKA